MTYLLMVNRKWMVKFDYEGSNGGAEHQILDQFDGVESCQAFTKEEACTEWFVRDYLMYTELISMNELKEKSEAYKKACKNMNLLKSMVKDIDKEIEAAEQKLYELREERNQYLEGQIAAEDTVKETRKEIGLRDER